MAEEGRYGLFTDAVVRVGEISLKGQNRSKFEELLVRNIRWALKNVPNCTVQRVEGRMLVHVPAGIDEEVTHALSRVFGVVSFSPVLIVPPDVQSIEDGLSKLALRHKAAGAPRSFKVEVRRANKRFPVPSQDAARQFGSFVYRLLPDWTVKMENPDVLFSVDIRNDGAYVFDETIPGLGGMPLGMSGKVGLLLSGGIDSPVAGWLCMKRGVSIEAIHFHSFPFTSERALQKVQSLANILASWGQPVTFHTVPFTKIQTEIRKHCPEPLYVTVMRRMMMRIASEIARRRNLLALATGESVGQVASQTLESMHVINAVTNLPILRPLVSTDKVDIIRMARNIGTYDTSILPYEDCCTVFVPKHPRTRPTLDEAERAEANLDIEALVQEAVNETVVETFHGHDVI